MRISYPDGADPAEVQAAYMASPGFAADMDGFDVSNIINVEEVLLDPIGRVTAHVRTPRVEAAAAELGLSPRTLTRRSDPCPT